MHTNRKPKEHRRHISAFKIGSRIGMPTQGGVAEGKITGLDQGGWIYASWNHPLGQKLPSYFRSTQVFLLGDQNETSA